jgi:hypothetical protein
VGVGTEAQDDEAGFFGELGDVSGYEGFWGVERTMAWSTCQAEGRWVRKMEPIRSVRREWRGYTREEMSMCESVVEKGNVSGKR